jgi:hypothetical protein
MSDDNSNNNSNNDSASNILDNLKKGWGATVEKTKEITAVAAEKTKAGWEVTVAKTNEGLSKTREIIHETAKPKEADEAAATRDVLEGEEKPNLLTAIGKKTGEILNTTKGVIYDVTKPKAEKEGETQAAAGAPEGDDDV